VELGCSAGVWLMFSGHGLGVEFRVLDRGNFAAGEKILMLLRILI
jgi:hypothetical protein